MMHSNGVPRRGPGLVVFVLFLASGAAGLVYQVLWLRQLTLIFGATAYASSAVLSTFMGGLALGSYWAGRNADRWKLPPLRVYALLEIGVTLYAAALPWLLSRVPPLLALIWNLGASRHFLALGLAKFGIIALLILPATTLMGATLPVLSRIAATAKHGAGSGVGALYATNTFGAVLGTIVSAFVALPTLGMRRTLIANLMLNGLVGAVAWVLGRSTPATALSLEQPDAAAPDAHRGFRILLLAFGASGFGAMVLEVAWTRALALVLGSSVYAYASMLTAFLIGLAAGSGSASYYLRRRKSVDARMGLAIVIGIAGCCSFVAAYVVQALPRLFAWVYFGFHPSPEGWWLAQLLIASIVMVPTTYALGWVFPLALDTASRSSAGIAASVGRIYAANTVGTIAGAACAGFLLIPWLGVSTSLTGVAVGQILLCALLAWFATGAERARRVLLVTCGAVALLCIVLRPRWDVLMMNSGVYMNVQETDPAGGWAAFREHVRSNNQLVYARDGLTASVLVGLQPHFDNLYLAVNGKIDASSREDLETQVMVGHLPLLLHPDPRDVLVIGLASGITVGSVATHSVERIRVVELEPAMIEAARRFDRFNNAVLDDPRVTLSINDARNELQFNPATYDVIISEPSNPWMTVAANLFTEDFFRVGRARLRPGGVFGQWIQTYCLTPGALRSILAAFRSAFPHVLVFATNDGVDLLVLGSKAPLSLDTEAVEKRMSELWVRADLARVGVHGALDVAAMLQSGGTALDNVLAGAPRNTDDNGLVEFSAPKSLYLDTQDANMAMLQGEERDPMRALSDLVQSPENPETLRFEMVRRWVHRSESGRATRAAELLGDTSLKSQAAELLRPPG